MDEAAAKIRMEMNSAPAEIDDGRRKLIQLEIEREALKREKDANSNERLINVKDEIGNLKKTLDEEVSVWHQEKTVVNEI